jgi:hypothetical protein
MHGTGLALLGWAAYAVAREHRIARLRHAVRNRHASQGGETGVAQGRGLATAQVAPVCAHRLLQGSACPLARDAWKRAHIVVVWGRGLVPVGQRVRTSRLIYDLRGGAA